MPSEPELHGPVYPPEIRWRREMAALQLAEIARADEQHDHAERLLADPAFARRQRRVERARIARSLHRGYAARWGR